MRIPPFQRAYCWDEKLAAGWWRDSQGGPHSTGKAIFCPIRGSDPRAELIVVDGQQRLTTMCLCVSAIRDEALHSLATAPETAEELARACDAVLFSDSFAAQQWFEASQALLAMGSAGWHEVLPPDGEALSFLSLVPTFRDRLAFQQLLAAGRLGLHPSAPESPMAEVRAAFDQAVRGRSLQQLESDLRRMLDSMTVMSMTIVDPPPGLARQLYQWAQEKAMTIGMELLNPKPGVCLTVSDLVRNLVLAPLLDRPAGEMEEVLRQHWLPLELRFGSPVQFDAFLQRFVDAAPLAPVSEAAALILASADGAASMGGRDAEAQFRLYARVLCEYDVVSQAQVESGADELAAIAALSAKLRRFADGGPKDVKGSAVAGVAKPLPPPLPRRNFVAPARAASHALSLVGEALSPIGEA